ncbi:MAG: glycosyltransferase family 39 protein [Verrucomicrobiota bacterium]|nr:glycosyltransferase family 39 protein [Verrucomicrobiota bacterium]
MKKIFLILILALFVRIGISVTLPLIDPTEGRYAQISQEMALSGDWVTPRIWVNGEHIPFLGKPPVFFWCSAFFMKIFGISEITARLPSLVAIMGLFFLILNILSKYKGTEIAEETSLILVSSLFLFIMSSSVIVDILLMTFVAGASFCYFAFLKEESLKIKKRWSFSVFLLLALGFLTKGPVAIILFGMPVFMWTLLNNKWKDLRNHAWILGLISFSLLVVPWFFLAEKANPGFIHYFFVNENFLRYVQHNYGDLYGNGHVYPHGSALLMMFLTTLPWGFFAIKPIWKNIQQWRLNRDLKFLKDYFFIGFIINTIFWCFAKQLLMTYMLPSLPMFAVWLASRQPFSQMKNNKTFNLPNIAGSLILLYSSLTVIFFVYLRVYSINGIQKVKGVIETAEMTMHIPKEKIKFLFLRRIPNSSYFYARGKIIPHPKESVDDSLKRAFDFSDEVCIVSKKAYVYRISEKFFKKLSFVSKYSRWYIYRLKKDIDSDYSLEK